jgi:3-deoxy-7-phosphoheptulonate synthase
LILFLTENITPAQIAELQLHLNQIGCDGTMLPKHNAILSPNLKDPSIQEKYPFIGSVKSIDSPFQLPSLSFKKETLFEVNGIAIGTHFNNMIAGPCSIENEEQIFETAAFLQKQQIRFLRGGAYKPRTSPYSFRGLGKDGLKLMKQAADANGMAVVTELMDLSLLEEVLQYTDIIQIGSRNMANFYMLAELGKVNKPILLKRGMQAKVNEWLLAADYIMSGGNENIILCERGIRSFDPASRNVMDIGVIPLVQSLSHLPILADPSHGTGDAQFVTAMSKAAMVAGANGLLIEVHPNPKKALSDSKQALSFSQFEKLMQEIESLKPAIKNPIDASYSVTA